MGDLNIRPKPPKPRMGKLSNERGWYIDAPESLYTDKTMEGVYQFYVGTLMARTIMQDRPYADDRYFAMCA